MSQLAEILRTLRQGELVYFSSNIQADGLFIDCVKIDDKGYEYRETRVVTHSLINLSIIEEPEAIELQDMLTKLREHAEGKEQ